jgi:ribonuclease Z
LRVVVLGTSPPLSAIRPGRAGTGIVVSVGRSHVLLDCGPGVTRRAAEAGIDIRHVGHLLLTHHHWDHTADLPAFVLGRWEKSVLGSAAGDPVAGELTILGPPPTERIISLLFGEQGVYAGDIKSRTSADMGTPIYAGCGATTPLDSPVPRTVDVQPGLVLETPSFRVVAAEAQHTQPYLTSLAYRIDSADGSVVFSGDTAPCDRVVDLARKADLLLHEGAMPEERRQQAAMQHVHSSPSTVGRVAARANVKQLVIVHHHLERSDRTSIDELTDDIRVHFSGDIRIGFELDSFEIPSTELSANG